MFPQVFIYLPMISVNHLTYTYPKAAAPAVRDVSFDVAKGEIFGFLGPSGAGKSTAQKLLIRLLTGYQGDISVLGRALSQWDHAYYEQIGVGFELPNHYLKLTARENLAFFASFYPRPCQSPAHLMAQVGLSHALDQKVSEFSKGMKMRLNFVRSFMHDPQVLFFDEPTSGLDPSNARNIKDIILELKRQGKTIFLTTHSMADADELCDRVAFIVDGQLAAIDSPRQLKLQHGRRKVRVEYQHEGLQQAEFDLDGLGHNPDFWNVLRDQDVQTIHSEEATLEDIFITITGKSLVPAS
jgi:fluoroquinolone transport system ATP-binding protein